MLLLFFKSHIPGYTRRGLGAKPIIVGAYERGKPKETGWNETNGVHRNELHLPKPKQGEQWSRGHKVIVTVKPHPTEAGRHHVNVKDEWQYQGRPVSMFNKDGVADSVEEGKEKGMTHARAVANTLMLD